MQKSLKAAETVCCYLEDEGPLNFGRRNALLTKTEAMPSLSLRTTFDPS
jgi:hypothetical protein